MNMRLKPGFLLLVALGCAGFATNRACAQTHEAQAATASHRYLLVVDTSRAMGRRSDGVLQVVQQLLESGMSRQLRAGDTLGVWTFNQNLYTGRFPLQYWPTAEQNAVVTRVLEFLQSQKYDKQADLGKALAGIDRVIKDSQHIAVILLSDGVEKMRGTPFDEQINAAFEQWREEQQKARMPLVTVLRASKGVFTGFTVNPAPWPVEMPPLPLEVQVAKAVEPKPAAPPKPAKPPVAQPLILSGKKPAKAPAPVLSSEAPKPQPAPAPEVAQAPAISKATSTTATEPVSAHSQPAVSQPEPGPTPPSEVVGTTMGKPDETASSPQLSPPAEEREMRPGSVASSSLAANNSASAPNPPAAQTSATVEPAPAAPAPVAGVVPPAAARDMSPAQSATAVPSRNISEAKLAVLVGLVLGVILAGVVAVLWRRSRPLPQASLITRSLDRQSR